MEKYNQPSDEEFDFEDLKEDPILVVTNRARLNGAVSIFYPGMMKLIGENIGDFFVLPSSIHEVLILPDDGFYDYLSLQEMVQSINMFEVAEEEQLSNKVYRYSVKTGVFEPAEDFYTRLPEEERKCSAL